jgi:hypothetical protein
MTYGAVVICRALKSVATIRWLPEDIFQRTLNEAPGNGGFNLSLQGQLIASE